MISKSNLNLSLTYADTSEYNTPTNAPLISAAVTTTTGGPGQITATTDEVNAPKTICPAAPKLEYPDPQAKAPARPANIIGIARVNVVVK